MKKIFQLRLSYLRTKEDVALVLDLVVAAVAMKKQRLHPVVSPGLEILAPFETRTVSLSAEQVIPAALKPPE